MTASLFLMTEKGNLRAPQFHCLLIKSFLAIVCLYYERYSFKKLKKSKKALGDLRLQYA